MRILALLGASALLMIGIALGCEHASQPVTTPAPTSGTDGEIAPGDDNGPVTGVTTPGGERTLDSVPGTSVVTLAGSGPFEFGSKSPWTSAGVTADPGSIYRLYLLVDGDQKITARTTGDNLLRGNLAGNASVVRPYTAGPLALQVGNYSTFGAPLNPDAQAVTWALSVTRADDSYENNDTVATARARTVSSTYTTGVKIGLGNGTTTGPDANDFFKFPLTAGYSYSIEALWTGAADYNVTNAKIDIVIFDASNNQILRKLDDGLGETNTMTFKPTKTGNYTVQYVLKSASYNKDSGKGICYIPYSFRVRQLTLN
ncbi:MAG: hypothetical protein ABI743_12095 [bacterium]